MRELLTSINDYDLCITEFVRVVDSLLPTKAFYRLCPELQTESRTKKWNTGARQLLGQHPQWLAENAFRAVSLGSWGVDLNCGCPSKQSMVVVVVLLFKTARNDLSANKSNA